MTFAPGNKMGIKGRKKGVPDRRVAYRALLEPHMGELIDVLVKKAKSGDLFAIKLCLERVIPRAQSEVASIKLPQTITPESLLQVGETILKAVGNQEMTLDEAKSLLEIIKGYRENILVDSLSKTFHELQEKLEASRAGNKS
jgi:hypothetical protein